MNEIKEMPAGTQLVVGSHTLRSVIVYCGCSQWGTRTWDVTGKVLTFLVDGLLIEDCETTVWDGSNHHPRRTPWYSTLDARVDESEPDEGGLKLADTKTLRELARDLPQALKAWIEASEAEIVETVAAANILTKSR
jgi:hypothetical protein